MTDTITRVELAKWFDGPVMPESGRAKLFGEMVKRALPIVENYHSDLYHDARYLDRHIAKHGDRFYYCIDDNGTHIGTNDVILEHRKKAQYLVTIYKEDKVWYAMFGKII